MLFGVGGFGLTRLLLPDGLRRYELLWVLPVGACAVGLVMTVLGYAYVPFRVSLAAVLVGGAALGAWALWRERTHPSASLPRRQLVRVAAWPGWIALLLCCVALIPLFRAGFATVGGQGQDAHLAVGTAIFLQRHHPTDIAPKEAVDRVPLVWESKPSIYYALGANASLAGLEVFETLSTTAAVLLGLAACGFFLLCVCVLRAPPWLGLVAMGLVGLNRMVLHTVMHPYFNQTWGFMSMIFALVLLWWLVRHPSKGGLVLFALFVAVMFMSYPLTLPILVIPLLFAAWEQRRRLSWRRLYHGRRSLLWLIPLGIALLIPLSAGLRKVESAQNTILNPNRGLDTWAGDLLGYFPEPWFFGMNYWAALIVAAPVLAWLAWLGLREVEPALRRGLLALFAFAAVFAVYFRLRAMGYYFEFKLLAFVVPILLTVVVAGMARTPRAWMGAAAAVVLLGLANSAANRELSRTFDQLPKSMLALRTIDRELPKGASIRLDVDPQMQNWVAFMLHGHPLCSQRPLLGTSYPRVPTARRADYILTHTRTRVPADAVGGPVRRLDAWNLYRARPGLPGPDRCSQTMVQSVTEVTV
ncbi:MAG TPA: hypothetical protein VFZ89_16825 [Solirubrobacteraceae bacterium]